MTNEKFRAIEHLDSDILCFPLKAMSECGQAAQSLAAIYRLAGRSQRYSTFAGLSLIKSEACLSGKTVRTVQRHLQSLQDNGWITNDLCRRRRTNSWILTKKGLARKEPFGALPRWMAKLLLDFELPWSCAAVLSIIISEHLLQRRLILADDGYSDSRACPSLRTLKKKTGLCTTSIVKAKKLLREKEIIDDGENWPLNWPWWPPDIAINGSLWLPTSAFPQSVFSTAKSRKNVADEVQNRHGSTSKNVATGVDFRRGRGPFLSCAYEKNY